MTRKGEEGLVELLLEHPGVERAGIWPVVFCSELDDSIVQWLLSDSASMRDLKDFIKKRPANFIQCLINSEWDNVVAAVLSHAQVAIPTERDADCDTLLHRLVRPSWRQGKIGFVCVSKKMRSVRAVLSRNQIDVNAKN